jgi:hypothetical protein
MLLLPLLAAIIVACDNGSGAAARAPYEGIPEGRPRGLGGSVPDPAEVLETKPAGQMPEFLSKLSGKQLETTTALYQGAVDHYDAYEHIPCYCGCAIYESAHKNLRECYIAEKTAGGELVFTDHSITCSLCQEGAKMTLEGIAQGTPLKDVRASIFEKLNYTEIWTDTDPVP